MADTYQPIDPKKWVIYLFVDDGTAKAAVSVRIFRNIKSDKKPDPGENASLILQPSRNIEVPQNWGFAYKNGTPNELCWGHELGAKLDSREVPLTDVYIFKHLKVCLFPSIDVSELEQAILAELERMPEPRWTADELHHHRLTKLHEDIFNALVRHAKSFGFNADDLRQIESHTFWGVPEMATPAQCSKLQDLLESANFQNVKLMTEAEAIGAWRSYAVERRWENEWCDIPPSIRAPHDVLIIDAGGLTAHGIRAACSGFGKDGEFVLEEAKADARIGKALGAVPCIDERLYQHAKSYIGEKYGEFSQWLTSIGMTELTLRYLLSARFERHKIYFNGYNIDVDEDLELPIKTDVVDLNGKKIVYGVRVTGRHIKIWYDDAWEKIRTEIAEVLLTTETRHLIVDGGFFRNEYLRRQVEAFANEWDLHLTIEVQSAYKTSHPPVCNGLGCIAFKLRGQPVQVPQFLLGMHQDELYERGMHTDIPPESDLLEDSETNNGEIVKVVPHRWQILISQTDLNREGRIPRHEWLPQQFLLTLDDSTIRKTIYYTTNLNIQNSDPILVDGTTVRADLQEFKTIVIDLSREELLEYPQYDRPRRGLRASDVRYSVWAWLRITRSGPNLDQIQLAWDLATPGWEPTASGNVRRSDFREKALRSDVLVSKKFLPFLQRNKVSAPEPAVATLVEPSNMDFFADEEEMDMDDTGTYGEERSKKRRKRRS